jgi:hypothetical protein
MKFRDNTKGKRKNKETAEKASQVLTRELGPAWNGYQGRMARGDTVRRDSCVWARLLLVFSLLCFTQFLWFFFMLTSFVWSTLFPPISPNSVISMFVPLAFSGFRLHGGEGLGFLGSSRIWSYHQHNRKHESVWFGWRIRHLIPNYSLQVFILAYNIQMYTIPLLWDCLDRVVCAKLYRSLGELLSCYNIHICGNKGLHVCAASSITCIDPWRKNCLQHQHKLQSILTWTANSPRSTHRHSPNFSVCYISCAILFWSTYVGNGTYICCIAISEQHMQIPS